MRGYAGALLISIFCLTLAAVLVAPPPAEARFTEDYAASVVPEDAEFAAGREAIRAKDWFLAVRMFRAAVARKPDDADAWTMLGFSLRRSGEVESALFAYDRALALDAAHRDALEYLGKAYLQLGLPDDARALLPRLNAACAEADGRKPRDATDVEAGVCRHHDDLRAAITEYDIRPAGTASEEDAASGW